tara:strand:- start:1059 stop:1229 length:171 start_codon:yes stop_codon:yes gene_type:complete
LEGRLSQRHKWGIKTDVLSEILKYEKVYRQNSFLDYQINDVVKFKVLRNIFIYNPK